MTDEQKRERKRRNAEAQRAYERARAAQLNGYPNRKLPTQDQTLTHHPGYRYYAIAETKYWGVYKKWGDITKRQPRYYKAFNDRHGAEMWLEQEAKIPDEELAKPLTKQPETIDLTACDTADAVTLEDVKRQLKSNVQRRIEARVKDPKSKAAPAYRTQVQSKVTKFFTPTEVRSRIN